MSDWIQHHGQGQPKLPMEARVHVRFRDGIELCNTVRYWHEFGDVTMSNWVFNDKGPENDIVAYRVVPHE